MNWTFWKRSKRTLATSGLLRGLTDCHSHLLPGVDDGVRSLNESLQILADMESAGIRKVWLTPHTDIKDELKNTSINITCYDKDGNVIKQVTSTDPGEVEEGEETTDPDGTGGGEEEGGSPL